MLTLKGYQQRALDTLASFFRETVRTGEPMIAFTKEMREQYGVAKPYTPAAGLPDAMPYVCLRMPTGAGKTLVACHAVGSAVRDYKEADRSLVVWLVPSTAILSQTLDALKDRGHPYRQALETSVGGPVRAVTVEEALYLNRTALDGETVVLVSTMQAFNVEKKDGRKVYAGDDGALMDVFSGRPAERLAELERFEDGEVKKSLENVLRLYRPIVVVDEAHNFLTDSALRTMSWMRPSAVLQLTATPYGTDRHPNVLHSVSASELKAEDMVKLPLELTAQGDPKTLLATAIGRLDDLDREAAAEQAATGERVRPIMLIQCEPSASGKDTLTPDVVEAMLQEDHNVPADQIAVEYTSRSDLDGVDLMAPGCPVRFVLTVQKLREGWDCPFAYVLTSLGSLTASTAVEQLVGRVLRMPHARRKQREPLNRAYVYAARTGILTAIRAIKDGLVANGVEEVEARSYIETPTTTGGEGLGLEGTPLGAQPSRVEVTVTLEEVPDLASLPAETRQKTTYEAKTGTLTFTGALDDADRVALKSVVREDTSLQGLEIAFEQVDVALGKRPPTPAQRGIPLRVPRLVLPGIGGRAPELFGETHLMEHPWSLNAVDAAVPGFTVPDALGETVTLDVEKTVTVGFVERVQQQTLLLADAHGWTAGSLAAWLDRKIPHPDISPSEAMAYLSRVIGWLTTEGGYTLDDLAYHKYRLRNAVERRIGEHRQAARKEAWQGFLDLGDSPLAVDPGKVLSYPENYPTGVPLYEGPYTFRNHRYRLIGGMNGEEVACAVEIDKHPSVAQWVRNQERRPRDSFWLQTATDRFYPDFVAQLRDDRILVVEYKGANLASNDDTKEKERLGNFWAAKSGGRCLFLMQKGPDLAPLRAQLG